MVSPTSEVIYLQTTRPSRACNTVHPADSPTLVHHVWSVLQPRRLSTHTKSLLVTVCGRPSASPKDDGEENPRASPPKNNHLSFRCSQAERERTVREAYLRLEVYKKAGVYGVLKRMEVWQVRSGRRIGDAFHRDTGEPPQVLRRPRFTKEYSPYLINLLPTKQSCSFFLWRSCQSARPC